MNYDNHDGIAVITLDDGKANVIGYALLDALNTALDEIERNCRALIIVGREGMFSGGFDLKEIRKGKAEEMALGNRGAHLFHRLLGFPMPVIGGCTGHAIAAGAFTLMSCDSRIGAAGQFKLGLNETTAGMLLPVFARELVDLRLARHHVTQAVIQARLYDPATAVEVGYLDEVVAPEQVLPRCLELAHQLGELPLDAYANMKLDMRKQTLATIEASLR